MNRLGTAFVDGFPILILFVTTCGIFISYYYSDAYILNRTGALIAAASAAAILVQIKEELFLESQVVRIRNVSSEIFEMRLGPIGRLIDRLRLSRREAEEASVHHQRLRIAGTVVFGAMLGELLHGFGDLFMCYCFTVCSRH